MKAFLAALHWLLARLARHGYYRAFTKLATQGNLGCRTTDISFLRQKFFMYGLKEWVSVPVPVNHKHATGVNSLIFDLLG
jgi:hypothetical protein